MKNYRVEYTYLAYCGEDIEGYEFDIAHVEAISPKQAIEKAKIVAPRNAKKFTIIS